MFVDSQIADFVRFCIGRLYCGLHYDELRELGLSLALDRLDHTKSIVDTVIDELDNGTTDDKPGR